MALTNVDSRSAMEENGWEFHVSHWDKSQFLYICGNETWYGFLRGHGRGSVSLNFKGSGFGVLKFGNCWAHSVVEVYLNSDKIAYALGNVTAKEIQFRFAPGDKLQVTEDGAIIKLHSLSITCYCKYTFLQLLQIKAQCMNLFNVMFQKYKHGTIFIFLILLCSW